MKSPELRVKIKSLASESLIIRQEMKRFATTNPYYARLHEHRVNEVRKESRATLIAYGFLNGLAYHEIEGSAYEAPDISKISYMVAKYGTEGTPQERLDALKDWIKTRVDNRGVHHPLSGEVETVNV